MCCLRAVLTCWMAHYAAYQQLFELQPALLAVVVADDIYSPERKEITTGEAKTKAKAIKMMKCIKDALFWHAITQIKQHLEPLAFAANVTQATLCRIDTVLLTFGFLMMQYKSMMEDKDVWAVTTIIQSIKQRWAKYDQEISITAMILNPFYKTTLFSYIPSLNNANVCTLLEHLYTCFFHCDPPPLFDDQVTSYF
ncbi:hypothetical protein PAXRUDRAFT_170934 [Paxillus rubicundulus Ve08.2h10]|uniref:Uncharacterized protein n=1 Tax=Paxillus rubicundulus Ve08.2h10 TaxID=930991 RepID=A0A0D0CLG9_9AGAM|nr:hypothetical protein PAXRUDRAFT_170934 [Paxillus rubicundulus Ve08.2h10]